MNLYASTLEGIRRARESKQQRLQSQMLAAAFRASDRMAAELRQAASVRRLLHGVSNDPSTSRNP